MFKGETRIHYWKKALTYALMFTSEAHLTREIEALISHTAERGSHVAYSRERLSCRIQ